MSEATRRYYDDNAQLILDLMGRQFNSALVSGADDLATCLADDFDYIARTADLRDGQAVLEGGSGNGLFCRRLRERFPALRYAGVELSEGQIALARGHNPGTEFRAGSFDQADWPPASFDRALFLESIGYSTDIDGLLQRLRHAVRPGGRVFIKNPGQKVSDWSDFLRHASAFDPVRREYGFDDRSLGIVPDIDFIVRKFRGHGFRLVREDHPFYNEYFYNAAFYAPGVARPVRRPEKTSIALDAAGFDPETSLSELGRRHPCYVRYHLQSATGTGYLPSNRLTGCVILVFELPAPARR